MPKRICIINVGANASHGKLRSPLFEDGTFEFIPIPENTKRHPNPNCPLLPQYRDLRSFNDRCSSLLRFVPKSYWDVRVHNDPEFETFTYGDYPTISPRAANLKRLEPGDYLFFLARLVRWADENFTKYTGFYLVGFIEVEEVLEEVISEPPPAKSHLFANNAHLRRALNNKELYDRFWIFKGSGYSRRFKYGIPFDRRFVAKAMPDSKWVWDDSRTDLQTIGSYTRSSRLIEGSEKLERFLAEVRNSDKREVHSE